MMLLHGRPINVSWIRFQSLDLFMLQMRSRYLAKLLDDFSSFGERVLLLIQESPASPVWVIGGQIVIEHTHWHMLCSNMIALLHVLRMSDLSSAQPRLSPWPDRALLEAAAARARGVFGRFAHGDISRPAVLSPRHLHSADAEQRHRASKRRREDQILS